MSLAVDTLETVLGIVKGMFPKCECRRAYLPEFDMTKLTAMKKPLITVSLDDRSGEELCRGKPIIRNTFYVDIIVQSAVKNDNREIDPLIDIVERLFDAFFMRIEEKAGGRTYLCHDPLHGEDAPFIVTNALRTSNYFLGMVNISVTVTADARDRSQDQGNQRAENP